MLKVIILMQTHYSERLKKIVIARIEATCLHAEVALRHAGVAIS